MSDDQSFYEIQLNTPHLVLAFLGAAVVGVAIFWLGVVIGRGAPADGPSDEWQAAAQGSEEDAATEEQPLEFYAAVNEPATNAASTAEADTAPAPMQPAAAEPEPVTDSGFQPAPENVQTPDIAVDSDAPRGRPAADPSLASGWIVQVRSTTDKPDADALQAALTTAGFPAFVVSADVDGTTWYRVRVGRYRLRPDADTVEAELVGRADVESTWVTEG